MQVDRHLADRDIEGVRLRFYINEQLGGMSVQERQAHTGRMRLATPESTLVDLIVHPQAGGGLSSIATVIAEIGELDVTELARMTSLRSRSIARRLGWMLARFRPDVNLRPLHAVAEPESGHPTRLVRALPARGAIDRAWNVQINANVEPDL